MLNGLFQLFLENKTNKTLSNIYAVVVMVVTADMQLWNVVGKALSLGPLFFVLLCVVRRAVMSSQNPIFWQTIVELATSLYGHPRTPLREGLLVPFHLLPHLLCATTPPV